MNISVVNHLTEEEEQCLKLAIGQP